MSINLALLMILAGTCFILGMSLARSRHQVRALKNALKTSKKKEEALLLIASQSKEMDEAVEKAKKVVHQGDEEAINQLYRDIIAGRI